MNEKIPEFSLDEALILLNFINNKLKNMNEKVVKIQLQQKSIVQSLNGAYEK